MERTYGVAAAAVALTAAGVALLFAVSPSGPAVTSATPPEGEALAAAPAAVELAVSKRPDAGRSHVSVVDGSGAAVPAGALAVTGADGLRLPVTITGRGTFTVVYHVELAGGGELTGSWRFGVGAAPDGSRPAGAAHEHGVDPVGAALLVVDGLVALGVIVLLLRRPRRPGRRGLAGRWGPGLGKPARR
jgi:methionine-rich copper-binding protein CopC